MKSFNKKDITSIICFTFFFTFMIIVFAPLEFYLSNKEYFFFSGEEMLLFICIFWLVSFFALSFFLLLIYRLVNSKIKWILGIFAGLALALYIQGNYIVVDYGVMDGRTIEWENYRIEGIISVTIFILIILLSMYFTYKVKSQNMFQVVQILSICLVLIQLVTLGVLIITKGGLHKEAEYVATEDGEFSLSQDENIIVLMLDTFDSQIFSSMLEDVNADQYKKILDNFIYYPDTVSSYAATDLAVPNILTGCIYRNDKTYGDYLREAYEVSPFLTKLQEDNWYCGIYSVCMPPQGNVAEKVNNYEKLERTVSSHRRLAQFMYQFVGFRYLPQPLKKLCWFYPDEMKSAIECTVDTSKTLYSDNNFYFYDKIPEIMANNDKRTFHFYHLDGTHAPFTIKEDFTGSPIEVGIEAEGRGMMVLINTFLEKLKEEGVYDNSTIVIMADHGFYDMRQNPLFIVKDKYANQKFSIRNTAISYLDLQKMFIEILNGKTANSALNTITLLDNQRIFYFYSWDYDLNENSYSAVIQEFNVTGKAWEPDYFKASGNIYRKCE